MDLSWSPEHKADATTILKDLQLEVKKNISQLNTNIHKLDNVSVALNEGKTTFQQVLCETCKSAVDSKYKELHSREDTSEKKLNYRKLPPERQEIVNEITKVFMQLEHSQTEDNGEGEFCTQDEYHAQQLLELEKSFKNQLLEKQTQLFDLKQQVKKLESERDENIKKVKTTSGKASSTGKYERELRRYQTENKRLQSDLDSSERRNEQLRKDIERSEDDVREQRQLLNEEKTRRETAEAADIRVMHSESYTSSAQVGRYANEEGSDMKDRNQVPTTDRHTGHDRAGLINKTKSDNVSSTPGIDQDIGSDTVDVGSTPEETIERLRKRERGAAIVQKENDDFRKDIAQLHRERKTLQEKVDNLQKTNEEMTVVMGDLQRDNDRLMREVDDHNSDFSKERKGERYERNHNENYEREIARLKRERKSLRGEIESVRRAHDDTSSALRDLQRDHDRLTEELGIKEREIHELKRALEDVPHLERRSLDTLNAPAGRYENEDDNYLRDEKQVQSTGRHTGHGKTKLINKKNSDNVSSTSDIGQDIEGVAVDVGSTKENSERLKKVEHGATIVQENDAFRKDIEKLHRERETLQEKTDHLQKTNEEMASEMRDLQRDKDRLMREQDDHNSDFSKMRKEERYERDHNENYEREIARLKRERQSLRGEIDSLRRAHKDKSSTLKELQRDHEGLTEELGIKEQETHEMKKAFEDSPQAERRSLVMKLRRGNRSGIDRTMVDMVFKELTRTLEGRFNSENIDFSIVLSNTSTNTVNGPSFVLILNTYVQTALQGIKGNRSTYILALHHIDQENISLMTPSRDNLTGNALQNLGGILDMAFSTDNELYECDINNSAVDKIVTLLKQY
ncbi:cingulin-like [Pecten maximus]|uniref:cingulin-like n=1 Tax=Pecten maximus TaxID=6579 RepID=UPI001458859A|nr:cingulin-like [Pecten maximus]